MNVGNSLCFRVVGAQKPNLQVGGRSPDDRALPLWKRRPPVGRPRDYGPCKPSFSPCAASPRPLGSSPKSPRSPLQGEPRFAAGRDRLAPGNAGRFRPGSGGGRRSSPSSPGCHCPKQQENVRISARKRGHLVEEDELYALVRFSCVFVPVFCLWELFSLPSARRRDTRRHCRPSWRFQGNLQDLATETRALRLIL